MMLEMVTNDDDDSEVLYFVCCDVMSDHMSKGIVINQQLLEF